MKNLQIQKMKQLNNYSFYLPFILSKLDIEVSNTDSNIIQLSYAVLLLSVIALYCLFNIIGYMTANIIVKNSNYEEKFPRLANFIHYRKKFQNFFLFINLLLIVITLLSTIFVNLSALIS